MLSSSLASSPTFTVPPPRPIEIHRSDLDAVIGDFVGRLVLLVAPSGYGKSTAAAQACASPHRPAVWIELSPDENDPVAFCRTVLWALGTITPLDAKE